MNVTINAAPEAEVTDTLGRKILLRKPDIVSQLDLIEALGSTASNEVYLRLVTPLLYVQEIDGKPFDIQPNKLGIKDAARRLGDEGMSAVVEGMSKLAEQYAKSEEDFKTAVKN